MSKSTFVDYVVHDLLGFIPSISSHRMFGGYGIYKNGTIFALILNEQLYFKTDEKSEEYFRSRGSKPFKYSTKKKQNIKLPYWLLPEEIMDNKEALEEWVERSVKISESSQKK
ncbi:MAG: TfoX/Sxy family protein [bacterium]